jgi:hypothetical protein
VIRGIKRVIAMYRLCKGTRERIQRDNPKERETPMRELESSNVLFCGG